MNSKEILWCEKYRPSKVDDCILPDRLKTPFIKCINDREVPNLILHGTSGVGKTTIAIAMCEEIGLDYMMINGSNESGIDVFRGKITNYASSMSLTGGRKVIIIDEADYLNATSTQPALRNAMEEFSSNCTFIFTCNYPAKLIPALHSRCASIQFNLQAHEKVNMARLFFKSVTEILGNENIPYDKDVVAEVVKKFFPDFRRTINQLQWYSRFGKIDSGILSQVNNSSIEEVVKYVKDKDFKSMRKWVATNDIDVVSIFRQLYDCFGETMMPASIPQAVIILADYQYKQAFVADSEINLVACLTELMGSCEFN